MTEKEIETGILDYLATISNGFFWKNHNGAIYDPTRKVFRKNTNKHVYKGVPDILGVIDGRMIGIEVKKPKSDDSRKTYPTTEQLEFIAKIEACGGYGLIARSIADVQEYLTEYELV